MTKEESKSKFKKIIGIILNVLTYLFFALCLVALILSVAAKKDADGAVSLWGKQMRVVVSDSMAACPDTDVSDHEIKDIPIRSMIFIDLVPKDAAEAEAWYADLKAGDVLTFRYVYVSQETITHRIIEITPKETGGYMITLEGDNKASDSNTLTQTIDTSLEDSPNYVIGKVTAQNYWLGLLVATVKNPIGIVCIVIIPCVIIAVFEIFRLVGALTENRRKREREEQKKRDEEFEEMKRQLELLQQKQQENTPVAAPPADAEKSEESADKTDITE